MVSSEGRTADQLADEVGLIHGGGHREHFMAMAQLWNLEDLEVTAAIKVTPPGNPAGYDRVMAAAADDLLHDVAMHGRTLISALVLHELQNTGVGPRMWQARAVTAPVAYVLADEDD